MKIDPSLLPQAGLEAESTAKRKSKQQNDITGTMPGGSDIQVKLSPALQGIEKTLASMDINHSRIAAIKQALASGEYQINPERIANGLINNTLQSLVEGE